MRRGVVVAAVVGLLRKVLGALPSRLVKSRFDTSLRAERLALRL